MGYTDQTGANLLWQTASQQRLPPAVERHRARSIPMNRASPGHFREACSGLNGPAWRLRLQNHEGLLPSITRSSMCGSTPFLKDSATFYWKIDQQMVVDAAGNLFLTVKTAHPQVGGGGPLSGGLTAPMKRLGI